MDKLVFLPSAFLGVVFILVYLYRCHRIKKQFSLSVMISAVLRASGLVCGLFLITSTMSQKVKEILEGIDIYIFIAGIAVIFVSSQGLYRDIIKSTKTKDSEI